MLCLNPGTTVVLLINLSICLAEIILSPIKIWTRIHEISPQFLCWDVKIGTERSKFLSIVLIWKGTSQNLLSVSIVTHHFLFLLWNESQFPFAATFLLCITKTIEFSLTSYLFNCLKAFPLSSVINLFHNAYTLSIYFIKIFQKKTGSGTQIREKETIRRGIKW